jgi:hypothetical protein
MFWFEELVVVKRRHDIGMLFAGACPIAKSAEDLHFGFQLSLPVHSKYILPPSWNDVREID